jgi:hypothetical protein
MPSLNKVTSIISKFDELNKVWRVVAYMEDGTNVCLGNTPTEKGAKRMVTVHKKFHNLPLK